MSFLTRQDRTPKFAGHVLPDRTESRLIFFDILPMNNHKKGLKKRIGKKNLIFFPIFKRPASGKESGWFPDSPDFVNLPDFQAGCDVRLNPTI